MPTSFAVVRASLREFLFPKFRYEIENNEAAKNCISNIFIPSFHPTFAHSLPPQAA
jgi:hypothetical protein